MFSTFLIDGGPFAESSSVAIGLIGIDGVNPPDLFFSGLRLKETMVTINDCLPTSRGSEVNPLPPDSLGGARFKALSHKAHLL